jgi:hypothetical protein
MAYLSSSVYLKYASGFIEQTDFPLETLQYGDINYKYRWLKTDKVISRDYEVTLTVDGIDERIIFIDYLLGLILTHDYGGGHDYNLSFHEVSFTIFAEVNEHSISVESSAIDVSTYNQAKISGFKQSIAGFKDLKISIGSLEFIAFPNYNAPIIFEYSNEHVVKRGLVQFTGVENSGSLYECEKQSYAAVQVYDRMTWRSYYGLQSLPDIPERLTWGTLPLTWENWKIWEGGVA